MTARRRCDGCGEPEGKGPRRISQLSTARLCQTCKEGAGYHIADWVARQMGYPGVKSPEGVFMVNHDGVPFRLRKKKED